MLASQDIDGLVCPVLNVLTSLFSHKSELVEKSEIMDSDTLVNINLGKVRGRWVGKKRFVFEKELVRRKWSLLHNYKAWPRKR